MYTLSISKAVARSILCRFFVFCLSCALASISMAQEEGEGGEATEQVIYIPLKPAFVVNYGGAGKLRYIKTEVSVRVSNIDAANAVQYHMPFIRNNLVMLFASQTSETVSSQEGREKIRMAAVEEIRNVVEVENKTPREDVMEVFFNSFIVQR